MSFNEYVSDLCKRGMIDGHIAEMLTAKHREEVENPFAAFRRSVTGLLDEMWSRRHEKCNGCGPAEYADRFDDYLTQYEEGR